MPFLSRVPYSLILIPVEAAVFLKYCEAAALLWVEPEFKHLRGTEVLAYELTLREAGSIAEFFSYAFAEGALSGGRSLVDFRRPRRRVMVGIDRGDFHIYCRAARILECRWGIGGLNGLDLIAEDLRGRSARAIAESYLDDHTAHLAGAGRCLS